jgi:hypothetical protein
MRPMDWPLAIVIAIGNTCCAVALARDGDVGPAVAWAVPSVLWWGYALVRFATKG